jgi:uncharacterized membrane protein
VIAAVALFALVYARLALLRYEAFWQARFDVGNMVQAVWSTANGDFLTSTDSTGEQISRLAGHVDPLLALFAPLWWVWPDPRMLLVAQAAIVATGAFPAFWLGRRWLGDDRLALAGAGLYLLHPALGWATVTEFHPVTLAAPLLLFCIWAAVCEHDVALAVAAALAIGSKEQVGLAVAVLGLWMVFCLGRRRAGVILTSVSLAWVALAVLVITPHFNEGSASVFVGSRYGEFGDTPFQVLRGILTKPDLLIDVLSRSDRISYVLALALPLAGLSVLSPLTIAALPDLLLNLLSSRPEQHQVEYHYVAVIVPFLVAGAIDGLARLRRARRPVFLVRVLDRPGPLAIGLLVVVLAGGWRLGPLPVWANVPGGSEWRINEYRVDDHARVLAQAVALVPSDPDVAVSATNHVGAHLSARRRIFAFPTVKEAQWVVVDRLRPETLNEVTDADLDGALDRLARRSDMELVFYSDRVWVFRRGQTATSNATSSRFRATRTAVGAAASSSVSAR